MCCSHLSLSMLVVAGSRSHLLEISTHMNSIDVRKKQGGEGGGLPPNSTSQLIVHRLKLLQGCPRRYRGGGKVSRYMLHQSFTRLSRMI